jgi:hypothetical protein
LPAAHWPTTTCTTTAHHCRAGTSHHGTHPTAASHHPTCIHAVHRCHAAHLGKHARIQSSQRLRIEGRIPGHALHIGHRSILIEIRVGVVACTATCTCTCNCTSARTRTRTRTCARACTAAIKLITLRAGLSELDINLAQHMRKSISNATKDGETHQFPVNL